MCMKFAPLLRLAPTCGEMRKKKLISYGPSKFQCKLKTEQVAIKAKCPVEVGYRNCNMVGAEDQG